MPSLPEATLLPLLALAAVFEAVFALHTGVERVGRYIQVFYESRGERLIELGAHGDGVRPRVPERRQSIRSSPASSGSRRSSTSSRRCSRAPCRSNGLVIGLAHVLFIVRVVIAERHAAHQRATDLEHFLKLEERAGLARERNREQQRVLRALPRVGRVERSSRACAFIRSAAAANRDRGNLQAHRQVRVGRSLAEPAGETQRSGGGQTRSARSAHLPRSTRPADRRRASFTTVITPGRPHRAFSSATAASTACWNLASSAASAAESDDRKSTSIQASDGIAFTDVPPPIRPTLNVVRGSSGTWNSAIFATARPSAFAGFGRPKSREAVAARPLERDAIAVAADADDA